MKFGRGFRWWSEYDKIERQLAGVGSEGAI